MGCCNISTVTFMVVVVVLGSMASSTKAQQGCAQDLAPCADYLNNTDQPSTTCCTAIKDTVAKDLACLCKARSIATACSVTSDLWQCGLLGQAPIHSPPAAPAFPHINHSGRIAWTGLPALLFFWVSVMLY